MDGFRPGKVPMNVVAQRYGYSVQYEVLNDKVSEAFAQAVQEAGLRVAGQPRIAEKKALQPKARPSLRQFLKCSPKLSWRFGRCRGGKADRRSGRCCD